MMDLTINKHDAPMVMFAKMELQGNSAGVEKHRYVAEIEKRAVDAYGSLSKERAFAKFIVEDPVGWLLFKALKAAPGSEVGPEEPAKDDEPKFPGPAHAKLHAMAVDHQRAHYGMTYQQAYSHLYSRPENAALREKVKAEHLARVMDQV